MATKDMILYPATVNKSYGMEWIKKKRNSPLRAGFEPARGNPIGFQVERLNHSAITAFA